MSLAELTATSPAKRAHPRPAPPAPAQLDFACRLGSGVYAVKGSTRSASPRLPEYRQSTTGVTSVPVIAFPQSSSRSAPTTGFLSLLTLEQLDRRRRLDLGPVRLTLDAQELVEKEVAPSELAVRLAPLDAASRHRCLDLLTCSMCLSEGSARIRLAKTLFEIRQTLRERLEASYVDQHTPKALHIDALFAVDDRSFYVRGWMRDAEAEIRRLLALSPEGRNVDLTGRLVRYARPDVATLYGGGSARDRLGFLGYYELPVPSILMEGWTFMMFDGAGSAVEAPAPRVADEPIQVRTAFLADLIHDRKSERLLRQHTFPAVSRVQEKLGATVEIDEICVYGEAPRDPEVSIVVPLYRRIDFLQYQLAHYQHDLDLRSADLIYVLDSPELTDELIGLARQLWELYRIPFRLVLLNRNGGFSAANNAGASVATGRRLLFLNSDVIPSSPGWLTAMCRFYDETEGIGALGPKLLYEDGSLQHAGLYFRRSAESGAWMNAHHYKGLSGLFPPANVCRPVSAVTGACLMVDRDLFEQAGGLRGVYVQGDFEDSDLCLRLAQLGRTNWYLPQVELFHLEGQSYPTELRRMTFRYNAWLHSLLWGEFIQELTEASIGQ